MEDGKKKSLRLYFNSGGAEKLAKSVHLADPVAIQNNYTPVDYSGVNVNTATKNRIAKNSEQTGFFDRVKDLFSGESTPGGITDAYNLMQEKRLQGDLNALKNDLTLLKWKGDEIKLAKKYIEDSEQLEKLKGEILLLDEKTNPNVYQQYVKKINELLSSINQAEEIIKTEGKHSDILRSLFFDTSKKGSTLAQIDSWLYNNIFDRQAVLNLKNALGEMWSTTDSYVDAWNAITKSNNPIEAGVRLVGAAKSGHDKMAGGLVKGGEAVLENIGGMAGNAINNWRSVIRGELFDKDYSYRIDNAIRDSDTQDRTYDSFFTGASEIKNNSNLSNRFKQNLDYWEQDVNDKLDEKLRKALNVSEELLKGTWYFKPELIDPRFREALAHTDVGILGTITHPLYSFPELGSSFSDFKDFATLTGTDAAVSAITSDQVLKWLGKKAATTAIGGPLGKLLRGAADVLSTAEGIRAIRTTAAALETLPNLYLTNQMRLNETKLEVFDAYSNRVLNLLFDSGIDPRDIAKAADEKWNEIQSALPEGLRVPAPTSLEEKIGLAIALGVDINNPKWDKMQQDARKGLQKLYNENMSLAAKDYLEGMVFMPHAGKALKKALYRNLETPLAYETANLQQKMGVTRSLRPLVENGTATASLRAQYYAHKFVEDRLAKSLSPTAAVSAARVGKFVKNKVKQIMAVSPLEGVEEGQQHLLQTRYESGAYDNYQRPESSILDIHSLLNDQELGIEAVASYFGVNRGDPTNADPELRRAMNIGFTTALWFQSPQVLTNVLPSRMTHADNFRNLLAEVKTDFALKRLVGENYAAIQDDLHIGKFFDIFSKAGVTVDRVTDTLEEMKKYKGDLVEDEYIDEDIELARQTYNQYTSETLDKVRADRNIAKDSKEHKFLVQNAVREIRDYKRAFDLAQKSIDNLDHEQRLILDGILKELSELPNGVQGDLSNIGGRYGKFLQTTLADYNQLLKVLSGARQNWQTDQQLYEEAVERLTKRENMREEDARTNALEEVRKYIFDEYSEAERERGASGMKMYSPEEFIEQRLNAVLEYSKLPIYLKIIDDLTKQGLLQKLIQEETGTDINTDNLASVIDVIKLRREAIKKNAQAYIDRLNKETDWFNEVILPNVNRLRSIVGEKKEAPKKHTNIKKVLEQYGDIGVTDELVRLTMLEAINSATMQQLAPRAHAYVFGAVNPYQISIAIRPKKFSELTESQKNEYAKTKLEEAQAQGKPEPSRLQIGLMYNKEQQKRVNLFKELKKRYKKTASQSFLEGTLDNAEAAVANAERDINEADMLALLQESARLFIEQQLDEKINNYQERMKIYHTEKPEPVEEDYNTNGTEEEAPYEVQPESPIEEDIVEEQTSPLSGQEMSDEMRDALNLNSTGDTTEEAALAQLFGQQAAPDLAPVETPEPKEVPEETAASPQEELEEELEGEQPVDQSQEPEPTDHSLENNNTNPVTDQHVDDIDGETAPDATNNDEDDAPAYEDGHDVDEEPIGDLDAEDDETPQESSDQEETGSYESLDDDEEGYIHQDTSPTEGNEDVYESTAEQQNDYNPDEARNKRRVGKKGVSSNDEARSQYLSSLFSYQPNSTKPMFLGVSNGEEKSTPLKTTYPLQPGKALAEKLLDKSWITKCNVYYICSGNLYLKGKKDKNIVTVSIIIDDPNEKKTYAASMGTPGRYRYGEGAGQEEDGLKNLWLTLEVIGIDSKYIITNNKKRKQISPSEYSRLREQALTSMYLGEVAGTYVDDPQLKKNVTDWEKTLTREQLDEVDYKTRLLMAKNKNKIMTRPQMQELIDQLIVARNQIIEAYCQIDNDGTITIPKEIRKDVKPLIVTVSNGAFNNMEEDDVPIFRGLYDVKDINLAHDTESITQALENGDVYLGFGRGEFSNTPFAVSNVMDPRLNFNIRNKKGEAGKAGVLYLVVNTGDPYLVPVLLRAERFDVQEGVGLLNSEHNPVKLCISPTTGKVSTDGDVKPSLAEVILFLACGKLSPDEIPGRSALIGQRILDLIVHHGSKTLLDTDPASQNHIRELADKQFSVEDVKLGRDLTPTRCLIIAKNENGVRSQEAIPVDKIFLNDDLRREVVHKIAKNLHWNTEVTQEVKKTAMSDEFPADILSVLRGYFEDNPDAKEYKFCGLDRLSFKKDDFFKEEGGVLVNKRVNILSWMIANNHVMTDIGDRIFRDPFLFAQGLSGQVSPESIVHQLEEQGGQPKGPGVSVLDTAPAATSRVSDERLDKLSKVTGYGGVNDNVRRTLVKRYVAQDETGRLEVINRSGGTIVDLIALAVQYEKVAGEKPEETYKKQLTAAVLDYLNFINAQHVFDKTLTIDDVNGLDVTRNDVANTLSNGYIPELIVEKNGTVSVSIIHNSQLRDENLFTGVFSKVKHGDPLTDQEAREFLSRTLGIDQRNVLILDKVFDSMTHKEVYGLMSAAVDVLNGDLTGQITLSRANKLSSTYHEAFHYANLLLRNRLERVELYRQFVESKRPDLKKASLLDIEEAMAEDFKEYVLKMKRGEKLTIFGKILKFFKDIWDLINVFKKKDLVKKAYDRILAGEYASRTIDQESLNDFIANYPEGVFDKFTVPGQPYSAIEKLKYITDYRTFYAVSQALLGEFIAKENFKTVGDLKRLSKDQPFEKFVDTLIKQNINDKYRSNILSDVKNNIALFRSIVFLKLEQYGIKAYMRKDDLDVTTNTKEKAAEDTIGRDTGERDNPAHDIENFEVSKKDNVAFRAKLFLGQIEKRVFQRDPITGEKKAVCQTDNVLGLRQYETFGEAWTKMLNDLWMCDSFDKVGPDGRYERSSLMYRVENLSKSDPFYTAVLEKLKGLNVLNEEGELVRDVQLENQILATIKSQLPTVGYLRIQTAQQKKAAQGEYTDYMSEEETASAKIPSDIDKTVEMFTDNAFKAKRILPREWSKNAVISGLVGYDIVDGETVLTLLKEPVQQLWSRYQGLEQLLFDTVRKNRVTTLINKQILGQDNAKKVYDDCVERLISILQDMGIPSDEAVIENMILLQDPKSLNDYVRRVAGLLKLLTAQTGSVRFLIEKVLMPNVGKTEISYKRISQKTGKPSGKSVNTPINQMYYGFKSDTFITKYAEVYASVHPTPSDFSVASPEGKKIYPISQNNWISDTVRRLNENVNDIVTKLSRCPYQHRSMLLRDIAKSIPAGEKTNEQLIRLVGFVGIKDGDANKGADYFGMTRLEDYVSKMMMTFGKVETIGTPEAQQNILTNRMMVLPTMADKKTYYGIIHEKLSLLFADDEIVQNDGSWKFSDKTLRIFHDYFLDELDTVIQYYNKENIAHLVNNPGQRRKNYHGKEYKKGGKKTGRLDLSGNGGMFRYCYDFIIDPETGLNLNLMIEAKWKAQQIIEEQQGKSAIRELNSETDLDGFEMVRQYLKDIQKKYNSLRATRNNINRHLVNLIDSELNKLSSEPDLKLVDKVVEDGVTYYQPRKIPRDIILYYSEKAASQIGLSIKPKAYAISTLDRIACVNAVGNHTINSIISMIEYEKVFSGDLAFYKWKYFKDEDNIETVVDGVTVSVRKLKEKNSDRVKRLGAGLSPGDNIRTEYGDKIIEKYPELADEKYTNAYIDDTSYMSQYIQDVLDMFKIDRTIEHIMQDSPEWFTKFKEAHPEFKDLSDDQIFNRLYLRQKDDKTGKEYFDELWNSIDSKTLKSINLDVARLADPYTHVNVSDAQVLIRPELYRKIRIGLGQWSMIEDETGYSDEKAYKILQEDDTWMSDPEKHAIVSRLLLFPLKMTYFDNGVEQESPERNLAIPRYNKMAIFPLFKYIATSKTGRQLYERMNRKNNEIDMLSFDSAVKVGGNQDQPAPCHTAIRKKGDKNVRYTDDLGTLTDQLMANSDVFLKKSVPTANTFAEGEYKFPVQVQYLSRLLMQLNTEAHLDEERAIGSQMFKIAFSDIIENGTYGSNQNDSKNRTGKELRTEIMSLIDALTNKGRQRIIDKYLPESDHSTSRHAISRRLMKKIAKSNNLGQNLIDLLNGIPGTVAKSPGCIESSTSRRVFEQSVQSKVNAEVVEIHTNGGSAIQQSCFGFFGAPDVSVVDKQGIEKYDKQRFHVFNEGRPIKWSKKNGSMEVLLSMNFFKAVVPTNYQGSYSQMRQWLIDHDVIKGQKTDGTKAQPKPFGIGYRIPTQGMSSMFVFTVADVLPEQSGDLIIVPPEFTAQTGSDFDIDKLFLATMKYDKTDEESTLAGSEIFDKMVGKSAKEKKTAFRGDDVSDGAIQNRLLQDYMQIIADVRNFSLSRASIDTFTDIIHDDVLPSLTEQLQGALVGMSELTPVKQSSIKLEFKTGKEGIGPFALNITNHALTQFANLCMVYDDNVKPYGLGKLNAIRGQDGKHILGWLSAMVNAHVDVAKDPYIFTLNVNGITYNMTNFLIRAGKGMSTFSFIGQPILKDYCRLLNASGGFYGNNDGLVNVSGKFIDKKAQLRKALVQKYWAALVARAKADLADIQAGKFDEKDSKGFTILERIKGLKISKNGALQIENNEHLDVVFDSERMLRAAKDINTNGIEGASMESLYLQIMTIDAFNRLSKYADQLSELVLNSRIDTKKFGKDKAELYNFLNNYDLFRYNHTRTSVDWYIDGMSEKKIEEIKKSHSKEALSTYFEETFLDYKLKQAVLLSRNMLYRQSFTASKRYRLMFYNTMARLFEPVEINGPLKSIGYKQVMNQKTVLAVSNALSGLFRAKALDGTRRYKKGLDTQYTGPIDFTFGGDKALANDYVRLLLYGAPTKQDKIRYGEILDKMSWMDKPLFVRISNFISYISDPNNAADDADLYYELSSGLVDKTTGKVINDFLNYLKPIPPSQHFPQGLLLLKEAAYNRDKDTESVLTSAFADLLNHKSSTVRRLARELAIYAYYTSFGQNSKDAFFELVPLEFRVQYDQAIKDDLYNENKIAEHMGSAQTGVDYEEIVDSIVRNYWYNSDIVPVKEESSSIGKARDVFQVGSDDIGLARMRLRIQDKKSANVYGVIVTNDSYGDYFTVRHGKDTFLYKKVGEINKTQVVDKENKNTGEPSITNTSCGVYFIMPKLGRHSGSNHQFELASGSDTASVYEENQLPNIFKSDNLMLTLKNWMENLIQEHTVKKEDGTEIKGVGSQAQKLFNPSVHVDTEGSVFQTSVVPYNKKVKIGNEKYAVLLITTSFTPTNRYDIAGEFTENTNQVKGDNYVNATGDVRAVIQKGDLREAIMNSREVNLVLNFGESIESDKVLNVDKGTSQKLLEKAIRKWMKDHNIEKETPISIGQFGDNLDIKVTKKEIDEFVQKQVAIKQSMSDEEIDVEEVEKEAREQAPQLIKLDKATRLFGETLQNLMMDGYTINALHSTGNVGTEQAFVNAGRVLSEWLGFGQVYLYIPKSYMSIDNIAKYEDKMGMYDSEPVLIATKLEAEEAQGTVEAQNTIEETLTSAIEEEVQREELKETAEEDQSANSTEDDRTVETQEFEASVDDILGALGMDKSLFVDKNLFKAGKEVDTEAMNHCTNKGGE